MKRHIANTRQKVGELGRLADKTEADERRILERAQDRLDEVGAMIDRQRPGIDAASDEAQDRYVSLVEERGQLEMVIAKARKNLHA
jgi:hypothetical protein